MKAPSLTAAAGPASPRPRFDSLPPLSLYVHLPWCVRKCPYCDFNSYQTKGTLPETAYVDALLRDLDDERHAARERSIESVFIGGGTPSLFSGDAIRRLLDGVRARLTLEPGAEITLEANPGALEAERFERFRAAGVNRLSIGVQSLRNVQLRSLGRVHDADAAVDAVVAAGRAGFANVNVDLMYGLPGDDAAGAMQDLKIAVDLAPSHLSWYQLTLEPDTAFHRRPPPALPDDQGIADIEQCGRALLARHGYGRYEISGYAQGGRRCAHNLNYWRFGDYIGIGAGAHGKLTNPENAAIVRRQKPRNPLTYMASYGRDAGSGAGVAEERVSDAGQIVVEFMMNALRLIDGVGMGEFEQRTGAPADVIAAPLRVAVARGWMANEPGVLKATPAGLQVLNRLLCLF